MVGSVKSRVFYFFPLSGGDDPCGFRFRLESLDVMFIGNVQVSFGRVNSFHNPSEVLNILLLDP